MRNTVITAGLAAALLIAVATVGVAQTEQTTPLPAVVVCVGDKGSVVSSPSSDGSCNRGARAELAQHADAANLYAQLAQFGAALESTEDRLSKFGGQLEGNSAGLAEVSASLDRAVDVFTAFIDLKYPVKLELSDAITDEKGTWSATVDIRDAQPGSSVHEIVAPDMVVTLGTVAADGTFRTQLSGDCGEAAELVVISLAGVAITTAAGPPC